MSNLYLLKQFLYDCQDLCLWLMLKVALVKFLRLDKFSFHHDGSAFLRYLVEHETLKAVSNAFSRIATFESTTDGANVTILNTRKFILNKSIKLPLVDPSGVS